MKQTLLDITQNILSRLSSDEVNSIGDTTESLQVANIIKNKYFDIVGRVDLPEHDQLIQLDPSLDNTSPVLMYVPDGVAEVKWLKYFDSNILDGAAGGGHDINVNIVNNSGNGVNPPPGYLYVTILPVTQFIELTNGFNPQETDVESFTFSDTSNNYNYDYTFYYKNGQTPRFCTILSNYYVIFDAYDATQDSTLQSSKTMALGRIVPFFKMEDSFIPNLKDEEFQLLVNEATALAFYELKQQSHPLASQEARRGWTTVQKRKAVIDRPTYFNALPNFGRRGGGYRSNVSEFKERGWDAY